MEGVSALKEDLIVGRDDIDGKGKVVRGKGSAFKEDSAIGRVE